MNKLLALIIIGIVFPMILGSFPYQISKAGKVKIDILDMNGKNITTLVNDFLQAGEYKAEFYTSRLTSGTYLCYLNTEWKGSQANCRR